MRSMYTALCTCSAKLAVSCSIEASPSAVICKTCGKEYSPEETSLWESTAYRDGHDIDTLPKHKRIATPISIAKMRRYKSLEEAERRRAARISGDDEE